MTKPDAPARRPNDDQIPRKHPSIVAWEAWKKSNEGLSCAIGIATGQYLENRLWLAFLAGWNARDPR